MIQSAGAEYVADAVDISREPASERPLRKPLKRVHMRL
jgi:hypothetical protein